MLTALIYMTLNNLEFTPEAARAIAIELNFWITLITAIATIVIAVRVTRSARTRRGAGVPTDKGLAMDAWMINRPQHHDVPSSQTSYRDEPW